MHVNTKSRGKTCSRGFDEEPSGLSHNKGLARKQPSHKKPALDTCA